jgi:hypothetical protein
MSLEQFRIERAMSYKWSRAIQDGRVTKLKYFTWLYFQLEHHEKALKIYVHHLTDFDGAVAYCEFYSKVA